MQLYRANPWVTLSLRGLVLTRVVGNGVLVVPLDMTRDTQTHDDVRIHQSQKSAIGCAEYQGFGENKIAFDVVSGIVDAHLILLGSRFFMVCGSNAVILGRGSGRSYGDGCTV